MPTNRQIRKEKVATYAAGAARRRLRSKAARLLRSRFATRPELIMRIVRTRSVEFSNAPWKTAPIRPSRGASLARAVFADSNPVLVDVLAVMAEREDFALLSRVWASYGEQLERKLNVTVVDVVDRRRAGRSSARGHYEESRGRSGHEGRAARAHRQVPDRRHIDECGRQAHRRQRPVAAGKRSQRAQTINRWR